MSSDDDSPANKGITKNRPAKEFARRLRVARSRLGVSQEAIMVRWPSWTPRIHPAMLSRYECGYVIPSVILLVAFAEVYGVPWQELTRALAKDVKTLIDTVSR